MEKRGSYIKINKIIKFLVVTLITTTTSYSVYAQSTKEIDFKKLDNLLHSEFGEKFGTSVLVASESAILFRGVYGVINGSDVKKVNNETAFNIASITKSITATMALRLVDQGKIELSRTLDELFDNVPADKRSITISHLLSHKSGFDQNYVCDGDSVKEVALRKLMQDSVLFAPGSGFKYTNANYQLLAIIIEEVLKKSFEDTVREEILNLAGMNNSFFWHEVGDKENIAGKRHSDQNTPLFRDWGFIGSGGMYSTPTDLYNYWKILMSSSQLISESSLKKLLDGYYQTKSGINIGYGWFINDSTEWNSREIWTRGSESWGPNGVIRWFPERNTVIIVCTNSGEIGDRYSTGNKIVSKFIADFLWK